MTSAAPKSGPVFISFASADLAAADRFLAALERGGVPCWIAHRDIPPGTAYPVVITGAIQQARAMLVLVTDTANASPHVLREVEMAFGAGTPILPVRLSNVTLSPSFMYFLSTKQWLDAGTEFDDADIARVKVALDRLLAATPTSPDVPSPAPPPWWKQPVAITAALVIVAVMGVTALIIGRRDPAEAGRRRAGVSGRTTGPVSAPPAPPDASPEAKPPVVAGGSPSVAEASAAADPPPVAPETPPAAAGSRAGGSPRARTRINKADGQVYVWIPPGDFVMGCSPGDPDCSPDELPAHEVSVRGFWLAQTELTGSQYRRGMPGGDARVTAPDEPVTEIDWNAAKAYCAAIGGRLPTEAEWEYAARAGTTVRTYGRPTAVGWHRENSDDRVHPVGRLKPNAFDLYDMLGNVHEWVRDRYFNRYDDSGDAGEIVEPTGPPAFGTVRGGAWTTGSSDMRASARLSRLPDMAEGNMGVRCARDEGGRR